ncbi:MAG: hypothetical protein V1676_00015 [Candidatus Diapherotrites archaeon]
MNKLKGIWAVFLGMYTSQELAKYYRKDKTFKAAVLRSANAVFAGKITMEQYHCRNNKALKAAKARVN